MSLPKEPRQKMINMMYLVLTALLALNVSKEVLNAFKVVDGSLKRSNSNLTASTADIYFSFENAWNDSKTKEKAKLLKPKADSVKAETLLLEKIINKYRTQLLGAAGFDAKTNEMSKEDNLDIGSRIMDTEGGGKEIFDALKNYEANIKRIMGNDYAAAFPKGTPLADSSINSGSVFSTKLFHMQPVVANLTMLSKVLNDIKNTESQSVKYLFSKMDAVIWRYNKFEPLVSTNATYLMPGEELIVQAGLGAFNDAAKPNITIGGAGVAVGANGVGERKFSVSSSGSVPVNVSYKDPNTGEEKTISKTIQYTVGIPGGASVSANKMNVLYIGVPNPVTVGSGAGWEQTAVDFSGLSYTGSNGNYVVTPMGEEGVVNITVSAKGKQSSFPFRVKRLPPPEVFCANKKSGPISTAALIAQQGLTTKLDSEFDALYSVVSYKVTINGKATGYLDAQNKGNRWSGTAANLVNLLKPGCTVTFEDIKVVGPDKVVRPASNDVLSFYCK
jgi:gliding motility-associated protein GldM